MSKRARETKAKTPEKKKQKSGDLEPDANAKTDANIVEDFVELFLMVKEGEEVQHVPLKALVGQLFGLSLSTKNGILGKAIAAKFPALKALKNQTQTIGSKLYSLRVKMNTDLVFRGVGLRKKLTATAKDSEAYHRLKAATVGDVNLETVDLPSLYKCKTASGAITPAAAVTGTRRNKWPDITVLGRKQVREEGVDVTYFCIVIESGCSVVSTVHPPTLTGNRLDFTFLRERPSEHCEAGLYTGSYTLPPDVMIDSVRPLQVRGASGGFATFVNFPLSRKKHSVSLQPGDWRSNPDVVGLFSDSGDDADGIEDEDDDDKDSQIKADVEDDPDASDNESVTFVPN
ncbi:hypothetical protein DIPPA_13940 [Diplonema papillatum]|nr:hypothetical protein DIPPA_28846 [Diplonema papillatum]KAJ9441130.1 hypothetical protein DIPPA_09378 [Diplonema papillatum]KAJ9442559.1 hypothetical protein DIPPA_31826 [Diplonema papillatum]KAJ9445774.1 hypothetical protein DIPPA_01103 [Diplonema papillatum]KAJ9450472.1 hypothetical protein DIPPA_09207 [Diplonema papillatum]